jgi:pimeloyl-ACP methyl ester carboxylesterase
VEESGLDPSVELVDLEAAILTGSLDRPQRDTTPPSAAVTDRPTELFRMKLRSFERRPGERVTYGEIGHGDPLVFMPGWVSRLDEYGAGTDPRGLVIARLAADCRVVAYDRFGTGLSAGETDDFTLETSVIELVSLLDDLGEPAVTVFAASCSSPVALAVAARDERVARVVVFGGFACGPEVFHNQAVVDSMLTLVRSAWGMGSRVLANLLLPDRANEADFARFQRRAASPEVAAGFLGQMFSADVHDVLDHVEQPVLVMHYRDDPAVPVEGAHQLARGLARGELVLLEGACHLPAAADVDTVADTVARFSAGS